jgi:hypothetical protein
MTTPPHTTKKASENSQHKGTRRTNKTHNNKKEQIIKSHTTLINTQYLGTMTNGKTSYHQEE